MSYDRPKSSKNMITMAFLLVAIFILAVGGIALASR